MDENKKILEVTVRMPESLKRDMQDLADIEDRTLSDMIRITLSNTLYGLKHRIEVTGAHGESSPTMRGKQ